MIPRRELLWLAAAPLAAAPAKLIPLDEAGLATLVAAHRGKVVLLDFWATWCEPCRASMPSLVKLNAKLAPRGFRWLTISADEPEEEGAARAFLAQVGVKDAAYIKQAKNDQEFINSIDPKWSGALPAMFLYDRSGKRVRSFIGETDSNALEAAITKLLETRR